MEQRFYNSKSARGFYYNLEESPYVYVSPYGDSFKLPSAARVEMMERHVAEELDRVSRTLVRLGIADILQPEIVVMIKKAAIEGVHKRITRKG